MQGYSSAGFEFVAPDPDIILLVTAPLLIVESGGAALIIGGDGLMGAGLAFNSARVFGSGMRLSSLGSKLGNIVVAGGVVAASRSQKSASSSDFLASKSQTFQVMKQINPTGCRFNCAYTSIALDDALAGKGINPAIADVDGVLLQRMEVMLGRNAEFSQNALQKDLLGMKDRLLSLGNGSRAIVAAFDGRRGGHYFNAVNYKGKIMFLDAQNGKTYNIAQLHTDFKGFSYFITHKP